MLYDLATFGLTEMIDAGRRLRRLEGLHGSMEQAAGSVVDFFYEGLCGAGETDLNCVLARCFKTHRYGALPPELQQKAAAVVHGHAPDAEMQCLTLLATRGLLPAWNSRHGSSSHQAIPLPTVEIVSQAPMIAELLLQLGMEIEHVVHPVALTETAAGPALATFNVFHVERAAGSTMVPAQEEFVQQFGVESVLGFGGLLPAGELFAVILFTRVTISPETAALFRTLALGVKLVLLPFSGKRVFAEC